MKKEVEMYKYYAHSFDYTQEKEKNNHQIAILLKREKLTNKLSIIVSFICVIWSIIKIKGIDLRAEYFLGIFAIAVSLFIYSLHLENLTRKYIRFGIIIEVNKNTNKKIKDLIIETAKQEHIPITFLKPHISVSGSLVNSFVAYNVEVEIKMDNYVLFIKMYDELLDKAEIKISKNIEVNVEK